MKKREKRKHNVMQSSTKSIKSKDFFNEFTASLNGGTEIVFVNGEFKTDNPELIEALRTHPNCLK